MSNQSGIHINFSKRSIVEQAIYEYHKKNPGLIKKGLIDRYGFLALADQGASPEDLEIAFIESNAALEKAISVNRAIANRRNFLSGGHETLPSKKEIVHPSESPLAADDTSGF
jgi:hypothetical protein